MPSKTSRWAGGAEGRREVASPETRPQWGPSSTTHFLGSWCRSGPRRDAGCRSSSVDSASLLYLESGSLCMQAANADNHPLKLPRQRKSEQTLAARGVGFRTDPNPPPPKMLWLIYTTSGKVCKTEAGIPTMMKMSCLVCRLGGFSIFAAG